MSLDINQIALHQLIKRDEQTLELVLRDTLLEPTPTVVDMMAELHRVYSAKNKAYGMFNDESELAQSLRLQRQGEEDFLAFSRAATGRLRDELAKYPFADGGIVLFCHYRYLAVEYLLVTVLNNLSSMRVNVDNLHATAPDPTGKPFCHSPQTAHWRRGRAVREAWRYRAARSTADVRNEYRKREKEGEPGSPLLTVWIEVKSPR
jgi:hypothetical protein